MGLHSVNWETREKLCTKCGEVKPLEDFCKNKAAPEGYHFWCRVCHYQSNKEWCQRNHRTSKEWYRRYKKEYHLLRTYGLSLEEYEKMLEEQGGGCAVCGSVEALAVDHDHKSGEIRGIICRRCNQGIGRFEDNPVLLRKLARYLEGG